MRKLKIQIFFSRQCFYLLNRNKLEPLNEILVVNFILIKP